MELDPLEAGLRRGFEAVHHVEFLEQIPKVGRKPGHGALQAQPFADGGGDLLCRVQRRMGPGLVFAGQGPGIALFIEVVVKARVLGHRQGRRRVDINRPGAGASLRAHRSGIAGDDDRVGQRQ